MNYEEWVLSFPGEISGDGVWKIETYRLSMFLADMGWSDITKLMSDRRTIRLLDQRGHTVQEEPSSYHAPTVAHFALDREQLGQLLLNIPQSK